MTDTKLRFLTHDVQKTQMRKMQRLKILPHNRIYFGVLEFKHGGNIDTTCTKTLKLPLFGNVPAFCSMK